jgi:hypothetical protein
MPRFDGTGPRGTGPMTGRSEGYCVLELPETGRPVRGYVGMENAPVRLDQAPAVRSTRWPIMAAWRRGAFRQGRSSFARRGRGRRLRRW